MSAWGRNIQPGVQDAALVQGGGGREESPCTAALGFLSDASLAFSTARPRRISLYKNGGVFLSILSAGSFLANSVVVKKESRVIFSS
jgi:hypothetical protein